MPTIKEIAEAVIADAHASVQDRYAAIRAYNDERDGRRLAKNEYARKSLEDIQRDETFLEHLNRDIERQGLPKISAGVDDQGRQQFRVDDPRDEVRERIKKKKAERNARMAEPLQPEIDVDAWVKRQRGKTLTAIPTPKPIQAGVNLAELFDEKCAASDAASLNYKRTLTAKLTTEEKLANVDAYCDYIREQGRPSLYFFSASGRFGANGRYQPIRGVARPEFATEQVGWSQGHEAIEVTNAEKLFGFFANDLLRSGLKDMIRAQGEDPNAIPAAERPNRLAAAAEKVLKAMREEAQVGLACVRARVPISLRRIVHPAAWLGLELSAEEAVRWEG